MCVFVCVCACIPVSASEYMHMQRSEVNSGCWSLPSTFVRYRLPCCSTRIWQVSWVQASGDSPVSPLAVGAQRSQMYATVPCFWKVLEIQLQTYASTASAVLNEPSSLCSPGWPQSIQSILSQVLGLQTWATSPGFYRSTSRLLICVSGLGPCLCYKSWVTPSLAL